MTDFSGGDLGSGGWMKLALGAAVLLGVLGTRRAEAAITLQETVEPIDARLEAAGWMGIDVALVADAKNETAAGIDLANNLATSFVSVYDPIKKRFSWKPATWLFPVGGVGITGPIYQTWGAATEDSDGSTPLEQTGKDANGTDSFFSKGCRYLSVLDPFTEDITNPLSEDDGDIEGVGSQMTFSGVVPWQKQTASMDIAFLIIPVGANNVYFRGRVTDDINGGENMYLFDQVLNAPGISGSAAFSFKPEVAGAPEPGTIGIVVMMAGAMLMRRRRAMGR